MIFSEYQLKRLESMFDYDFFHPEFSLNPVLVCIGNISNTDIPEQLYKEDIYFEIMRGKLQIQKYYDAFEDSYIIKDRLYVLYRDIEKTIKIINENKPDLIILKKDIDKIWKNEIADGIYEFDGC